MPLMPLPSAGSHAVAPQRRIGLWRRSSSGYGEWLRWQINYRFAGTGDGEWTYRLETLNVAYGLVPADIFLGAPTHHVKELAPLR